MNKTIFLSISLLLSSAQYCTADNIVTRGEQHITLQSEVLHLFDGTSIGVNADTLELIGLVRREVNNVLIGKKTKDGTHVGAYTFEGQIYTLEQIAAIQKKGSLTPAQEQELTDAFKAAREDIKKHFRPFMNSARNTKHHMVKLIEESCRKRNNMDSFLLDWAEEKVGEEERGFDRRVTDAIKLESFCIDLINFLGDLVRSCPKAQQLFIARVKKCKKVSLMLPNVLRNITNDKSTIQKAFMHYMKEHHVDNMQLSDITHERLDVLFKNFIQNHY